MLFRSYLFTADGEFLAKDVYETASQEQCAEFAGDVAKTIINTNITAQFNCLSEDEYHHEVDKDI